VPCAPGIPSEWVVELKDGSFQRVPEDECTRAKANDEREEERICELRQAIQLILGRESDLTADEIWERLSTAVRANRERFKSILPTENGNLWVRKGGGSRPFLYSLKLDVG
jgi:ferric-dicitrate binding protein FerR (iron transport regulator)